MARIVHASNFGRKAKGAFQHGVEHKITNGLIRNGHAVSNFSDRDVARAGTLLGHLPPARKRPTAPSSTSASPSAPT